MFDYQLFLGFPLTDSYQKQLAQLEAYIYNTFIQNSSSYLQKIENEGMTYLGKYLGSSVEVAELDALQTHVYSLLKTLIPYYSYESNALLLFALPYPYQSP